MPTCLHFYNRIIQPVPTAIKAAAAIPSGPPTFKAGDAPLGEETDAEGIDTLNCRVPDSVNGGRTFADET